MKKLGLAGAGAVLLAGCSFIAVPAQSASSIASAPTRAALGDLSVTLSGSLWNNGQPSALPTRRTTGLSVTLTGSAPLPTTLTVQGLYVVSGDQVYKVAASNREVFTGSTLRYSGKLTTALAQGAQVNVAALVTDGKVTQLLRAEGLVTVNTAN